MWLYNTKMKSCTFLATYWEKPPDFDEKNGLETFQKWHGFQLTSRGTQKVISLFQILFWSYVQRRFFSQFISSSKKVYHNLWKKGFCAPSMALSNRDMGLPLERMCPYIVMSQVQNGMSECNATLYGLHAWWHNGYDIMYSHITSFKATYGCMIYRTRRCMVNWRTASRLL
jgi:hypothetical protein